MRIFFKTVLVIFVLLFALSGVFTLVGAAVSLTFGILGSALSLVWKVASNPVVLVLIIIYLAYKLNKTSGAKNGAA